MKRILSVVVAVIMAVFIAGLTTGCKQSTKKGGFTPEEIKALKEALNAPEVIPATDSEFLLGKKKEDYTRYRFLAEKGKEKQLKGKELIEFNALEVKVLEYQKLAAAERLADAHTETLGAHPKTGEVYPVREGEMLRESRRLADAHKEYDAVDPVTGEKVHHIGEFLGAQRENAVANWSVAKELEKRNKAAVEDSRNNADSAWALKEMNNRQRDAEQVPTGSDTAMPANQPTSPANNGNQNQTYINSNGAPSGAPVMEMRAPGNQRIVAASDAELLALKERQITQRAYGKWVVVSCSQRALDTGSNGQYYEYMYDLERQTGNIVYARTVLVKESGTNPTYRMLKDGDKIGFEVAGLDAEIAAAISEYNKNNKLDQAR